MEQQRTRSFGQRWSETRPTKTAVFWSWIAAVIVTMIIGFTWGGWVTGGTARDLSQANTTELVTPTVTL